MDQSVGITDELPEFGEARSDGAWYDRPADTSVLDGLDPDDEPTGSAADEATAGATAGATGPEFERKLAHTPAERPVATDEPAPRTSTHPLGSGGAAVVGGEWERGSSQQDAEPPENPEMSEWEQRFEAGLDPITSGTDGDARVEPVEGPEGEADLQNRLLPPSLPDGLGITLTVLEDILLRQVVADVRNNTSAIAKKLHVSANLVDVAIQAMRDRNLVEYQGMDGRSYVVSPTEAGRRHAQDRSGECRYIGPVPVSLRLYHEVVRAQHPVLHLDRQVLTDAFSDLVIAPDLLDELGPAIHGDGAMFLYGPPGTGKSSVAERIVRAHHDYVLIPYCLEVEGQIVAVFDPTLHTPVAEQPRGLDPRWVACERPAVIAGGELHAGMLDLAYEADSGVYLAPLQMKANNGIFVIDDFGRQSASPEELLNRWIVPLDRGIDYLTLMGRKFEVPFDLKVVLSTNMQPAKLGDDAFFRRIHSKVFVGSCSDWEFDEILRRVTEAMGIAVEPGAPEHLRHFARTQGDGELRAYLPGTVCKLARSVASYLGVAPVLDQEMIDRVMSLYFTREV